MTFTTSDQNVLYLEADWSMPETDFPAWEEMHRHIFNDHKPQTQVKRLQKAVQEWLPYRVCWHGGLLAAETPYGTYIWTFAVQIEQNRRWEYPEFVAGRVFGRSGKKYGANGKSWRDANPYPRISYDRHISWDCGYILGVAEKYAAVNGSWDAYRNRRR